MFVCDVSFVQRLYAMFILFNVCMRCFFCSTFVCDVSFGQRLYAMILFVNVCMQCFVWSKIVSDLKSHGQRLCVAKEVCTNVCKR